jgi:hypothetical protein
MGPLLTLQESGFAGAMRTSYFLYPTANVVHVLAALIFFASVAAMDIRVFRSVTVSEAREAMRGIRVVALVAFVVQVASGVMLFAPEATHIFENPVYRIKLVAILLGVLNVVLLEVLLRRGGGALPGGARASAVASIAVWLSVAALGRLIAYF